MAGFLADEALLGSLANGQLGSAFGALCALHDFLTQLVVTQWTAVLLQSVSHMVDFYLAAGSALCRCGAAAGGSKPESLRIQFEHSRLLGRGVAELEA